MTDDYNWYHISTMGRKTFVDGELVHEMSKDEYEIFLRIMKRWFAEDEEPADDQ